MDTTCQDCHHEKKVHCLLPSMPGCRVANCRCLFYDHGGAPPPMTPADLRRAVCAALRERVALDDQVATGALKVIEHLDMLRLHAKHYIEDMHLGRPNDDVERLRVLEELAS